MPSLVLEGGTFRPIFSDGVMNALLEEEILFPYCIGVSAGICNGTSYISRQPRRNLEILLKYRNDKRYIGSRNYLRCRSIFGMNFVFNEITERLIPFDFDTFFSDQGRFLVGVTNVKSGQAEYFEGKDLDKHGALLRATCAMPMLFPTIKVGEGRYLDGGLSDPIPIKRAIADGNEKHLILLTRPKGYQKGVDTYDKMAAAALRLRYPLISRLLLERHKNYNKMVRFCEELEEEGKAVLLRPEYPLDSYESDLGKIQANFEHGYEMAKKRMREIGRLL